MAMIFPSPFWGRSSDPFAMIVPLGSSHFLQLLRLFSSLWVLQFPQNQSSMINWWFEGIYLCFKFAPDQTYSSEIERIAMNLFLSSVLFNLWFNRYSNESGGQCTNPLIHFDPIKGLAVGFVIAYGLMTRLIRGTLRFRHDSIRIKSSLYVHDYTVHPCQTNLVQWSSFLVLSFYRLLDWLLSLFGRYSMRRIIQRKWKRKVRKIQCLQNNFLQYCSSFLHWWPFR